MYPELMVMAAVAAGIVVGLLIMTTTRMIKALLLAVKAAWQAKSSKGKRKPQVKRPRENKAAAAAQTPGVPKQKHKTAGKKVAKNPTKNPPAEKDKRRPGRPSNAELARRAAEAIKAAEAKAAAEVPNIAVETVMAAPHVQVTQLELTPDESLVMPIPEKSPQPAATNNDPTSSE